ncbi:MAG: hypothetical protein F9B45_24940 [Phycisphaera sp. RhM]|nr:hypothetical protein [Phycisphaera sp. RhM]
MSTEKFVVVKGSGGAGLGDRICGLAVGIAYAQITGRTLFVDWRDRAFQSQEDNLFPKLLTVRTVNQCQVLPQIDDVAPPVWQQRLDMEIDQVRAIDLRERGIEWSGAAPKWDRDEAVRRYSIDVSDFTRPERCVVVWSGASINGLLDQLKRNGAVAASFTADGFLGKVVRDSISFHPEIETRIQRFRHERFQDRMVLGIHHRKTEEAAAVRSIPSERQYFDATDRALAKMSSDTVIFLATDNADVQDLYAKRYGSQRVHWTDKWLPEGGQSIHKNAGCPDGSLAAKDALMDVGLLARCDRLVLTGNSSFSSLAGWFSTKPAATRELVFPYGGSVPRRALRMLKRLVGKAISSRNST